MKTKLRNLLIGKGVPEDVVGERVTSLLAKVPVDHIAKYKDDSDDAFWSKLKDDASDAKYRLITPAELKNFQVAQRKSKAAAPNEHKPKKAAKDKPAANDHGAISVDMTHFKAAGKPIG